MIVKICGTRHAENISQLVKAGASWIGFIFHPASPRFLPGKDHPEAWAETHATLTPLLADESFCRVGVFVNASLKNILEAKEKWQLDYVQLHGSESPDFCRSLQRDGADVIKAFGIATKEDIEKTKLYEDCAAYFLFDTATPQHGGSGQPFDWHIIRHAYNGVTPFLLSGGIGPESVDAIRQFAHPRLAGYDLNSRFETSPGMKEASAIARFIQQIK